MHVLTVRAEQSELEVRPIFKGSYDLNYSGPNSGTVTMKAFIKASRCVVS